VLLAPVLVTFIWIIVFGNTAIHMEIFGNGGIVQAVQTSIPTALYVLLDGLPGSLLSSALATIVVMTFFVTSSDSGSLVISILSSEGNPKPAKPLRLFWSLLQGAVAAVLLLTGGLIGLQTAALTTALPFCIVLILMCYSIYKGLKAESDGKSISELENRSPEGTSDNKAKQMIGELLGGEADE
jgi:choline/glycine/proline betaine transport protein